MYQVFRQCVAQSLYPHQRARCKTLLAETRHEKNRGFGRAKPKICLREVKTVFKKGLLQTVRHFAAAPYFILYCAFDSGKMLLDSFDGEAQYEAF